MFERKKFRSLAEAYIPRFVAGLQENGFDRVAALEFAVKYTSEGADLAADAVKGMKEDVNLADLFYSNEAPQTKYGQTWLPILHKYSAQRKADGVTEKDFIQHWNQPLLERVMQAQFIAAMHFGTWTLISRAGDWDSLEDMSRRAHLILRMSAPFFGLQSPEELNDMDPHRPFAYELFPRIANFHSNQDSWDEDTILRFQGRITFNGFIREEMRLGKL